MQSIQEKITNPVQIAEDRWLVKTSCHRCYIEVEHSSTSDFRWIAVGLLSNHVSWWNGRLPTRVREAWRILQGHSYESFELLDVEEADALLEALRIARQAAFGPAPEPTTRIQRFRKWFSRATSGR